MLTRLEQAQERWGGSHKVIDTWLEERQELLVHYCRQAGLPPFIKEHKDTLPTQEEIMTFCQVLVDYVSTGHFEIYEQVIKECSDNGCDSRTLTQELYPSVNVSTDAALQFNDRYAENMDDEKAKTFGEDLSNLGQLLAERFSHEDKLLQVLHEKHTQVTDLAS